MASKIVNSEEEELQFDDYDRTFQKRMPSTQASKTPIVKTDPLKRRRIVQALQKDSSSESEEETSLFYLYSYTYKGKEHYNITTGKDKIKISKTNLDEATCKHYGKEIMVKILKRGTEEYVKQKAEKHRYHLSLETGVDSDEYKKIQTQKEKQKLFKETPAKKAKSSSSISVTKIKENEKLAIEASQGVNTLMSQGLSTNDHNDDWAVSSKSQEFNNGNAVFQLNGDSNDIQKIFSNLMLSYNDKMEKKFEEERANSNKNIETLRSTIVAPRQLFMWKDKCLRRDIHGYPAYEWLKACIKHLFDADELKDNVFSKTSHSTRPELDDKRLALLHCKKFLNACNNIISLILIKQANFAFFL